MFVETETSRTTIRRRPWWLGGGRTETYDPIRSKISGLFRAVEGMCEASRYEDYLEVIRLLVPLASTEDRMPALKVAIELGLIEVVKLICDGPGFSNEDRNMFVDIGQRVGSRRLVAILDRPHVW